MLGLSRFSSIVVVLLLGILLTACGPDQREMYPVFPASEVSADVRELEATSSALDSLSENSKSFEEAYQIIDNYIETAKKMIEKYREPYKLKGDGDIYYLKDPDAMEAKISETKKMRADLVSLQSSYNFDLKQKVSVARRAQELLARSTNIEFDLSKDGSGSIVGRVYAPNSVDPISGATVKALADKSKVLATTLTNQNGDFVLNNIPMGDHQVNITLGDYSRTITTTVVAGRKTILPASETSLLSHSVKGIESHSPSWKIWEAEDSGVEGILSRMGMIPSLSVFTLKGDEDCLAGRCEPESLRKLSASSGSQIIIVSSEASLESLQSDAKTWRNWVEDGGRLVVMGDGAGLAMNVMGLDVKVESADPIEAETKTLRVVDPKALAWMMERDCQSEGSSVSPCVNSKAEMQINSFQNRRGNLKLSTGFEVLAEIEHQPALATLSLGRGRIIISLVMPSAQLGLLPTWQPQDRLMEYLAIRINQ